MEKITVVIPVYNCEKYIRKCIESVINQTYKNLEILIIIDGATDGSKDIIEEYAKKDTRIQIISRKNEGIFYTRIEGIRKATSNYIYFLDGDDWIEKNAIEIMYAYMEKYHCNIVRCQNYYKDEKVKVEVVKEIQFLKKEDFNNKLYKDLFGTHYFSSIWNQLIDKRIFEEMQNIDYNINYGEDYIINLNLYKNINSLLLIPNYFYHYRTNNNSITNTQNYEVLLKKLKSAYKSQREAIKMIDIYQTLQQNNEYQKLAIYKTIKILKNRIIEFGSFGIKAGQEKEVYQEIEKIVTLRELKEICGQITQKELLQLAKKENHKYIIKNIYLTNTQKIVTYIKRIYIPGKKIKRIIRR